MAPPPTQPAQGSNTTDTEAGSVTMWPPGTVLLEDFSNSARGKDVILHPRPTTDPNDPLNWSKKRKYLNFAIVCLYTAMVSEFTSSATPTWGPMQRELGHTDAQLNNSYAIGCAFLGIGAVLLVPFALKLGRRPLYLFSTLVQFGTAIWSARQTTYADLMLINVVQCGFGALGEVMVQMTIADVFFVHERGRLNSIYIWIWKVAAPLGSMLAGRIALAAGWRWVWWGNAIFIGVFTLVVAFLYEETKFQPSPGTVTVGPMPGQNPHPADGKSPDGAFEGAVGKVDTKTSADERGCQHHLYTVQVNPDIPLKTYRQKLSLTAGTSRDESLGSFVRHMYQPFILLATIPAVAYTAFVYGILVALNDVMSTTIATYMRAPPYSFNSAQIGLMSMPRIIGVTIGCVVGGPLSDWLVLFLSRRNKGVYEPEVRLWCFCLFVPLVPIGTVLTGVGLGDGLTWPLVALGIVLYNMGVAPINSVVLTYLTDSYQDVSRQHLAGAAYTMTLTLGRLSAMLLLV